MISSSDVVALSITVEDGTVFTINDPKVTRLTLANSPYTDKVLLIIHAEVPRRTFGNVSALPPADVDYVKAFEDATKALPETTEAIQDAEFTDEN